MNPFVCIADPFVVPLFSHGLPVIEAVPPAGSSGGTHAKVARAAGVVTPFTGARAISRGRKRKLRQRCPIQLNIGKQLKQLERQLPTTCLPGPGGGPSAFSLFLQFVFENCFVLFSSCLELSGEELVFSFVQSGVGRRVPSPPETGTCKRMSWVMRMQFSRDLGKHASAHFRRRPPV